MEEYNYLLIHLDVFYRDLLVVWGCWKDTREALLVFHDEERVSEIMDGFETWSKGRTVYSQEHNSFFAWIPEKPKTAQDIGFLIHELFHSTYAVMLNIGIPLSDDTEEAYAYTMGYLTEKVLEGFSISFSSCQEPELEQKQQPCTKQK